MAFRQAGNVPTDLLALMMDGVTIGDHTIVVALGIDRNGHMQVLGPREGSTENAAVATGLLNDLVELGLKTEKCLAVIDGGKGIRKAIIDVMGKDTPIQRCQLHKERNIDDTAKNAMLNLAKTLENNYPGAESSIREGLDDLFTVKKLGVKGPLAACLSSTNHIEALIGRGRVITGKVKRWRSGGIAMRWMSTALVEAEGGFRRIRISIEYTTQ